MEDLRVEEASEKVYDLEERTYLFAKQVRTFVKGLEKTISNIEDIRQLARSSGSIAANYIELNESLGPKDLLMKARTLNARRKRVFSGSACWTFSHMGRKKGTD